MNDVWDSAIFALELANDVVGSVSDVSVLETVVEESASVFWESANGVSVLEIVVVESVSVFSESANGDELAASDGHSSLLAMQPFEATLTFRDVSAVSDFDVAVAFLHSGYETAVSVEAVNDSDLIHRVEDFSNFVHLDRCETSCDLDLSTAVVALCLVTLDAYRSSLGNDFDVKYDFLALLALCDVSRCRLLLICPYRSFSSFYN